MWQWSTTDLDAFWRSVWDFFDLSSPTPFERALCEERMPGAVWFCGAQLNYAEQALRARIAASVRAALSPRFVPNLIVQAPEIPRTLSGKKQEVPIKRLFLGHAPEAVLNRDAMANPACLAWYLAEAARQSAQEAGSRDAIAPAQNTPSNSGRT